jgi:hypothetical protein
VKPEDFKKLVNRLTESDVTSDEPHVTMRCEENGISVRAVKDIIVGNEKKELTRVVEDRTKVYKLYYHLSRKTELKIIVDVFRHGSVNIRTVKILSTKHKLGRLRRKPK